MLDEPPAFRMLLRKRRDEHEGDLPLPKNIASLVAMSRLQAGVGDDVKTEGVAIEIGGLPGIAHEHADMVDAPQGEIVPHLDVGRLHHRRSILTTEGVSMPKIII